MTLSSVDPIKLDANIMSEIKLSNKTVLVTGAAGFIGSFLSKKLLESVDEIKIVGIASKVNKFHIM